MRERIENIQLSIRKISEKASEQEECVRFDIGQPSFDTPQHVKDATAKALEKPQGYSPILGIPGLRDAVVEEESNKKSLDGLERENVMVTTGGMGALYAVFAGYLGTDDTAVFNDPCWGPYKMISEVNGNLWNQVEYFEDGSLTEEAKTEIKNADLAVVNTPSNPAGRVLGEEQAREIGEFCDKNDTFLVSDEVYHRLIFDGKEHYSPAVHSDNAVIIGSASKNHAMTGWRVGWIIGDPEDLEEFAKVSRATTACPPRISQYAALEALENPSHVEEMRAAYERRRDVLVERMEDLGWEFQMPEGAIYAFPDVGRDSWEFCLEMVENGVAMVPGEPMGPESDTCVRICFGSTSVEEIERGFDILEEHL